MYTTTQPSMLQTHANSVSIMNQKYETMKTLHRTSLNLADRRFQNPGFTLPIGEDMFAGGPAANPRASRNQAVSALKVQSTPPFTVDYRLYGPPNMKKSKTKPSLMGSFRRSGLIVFINRPPCRNTSGTHLLHVWYIHLHSTSFLLGKRC